MTEQLLAVPVLVAVVVVTVVLVAMYRGWRGRGRRSGASLELLPTPPAHLGEALAAPFPATYVSTTSAGDWLDRVVAHDLGARSAAVVGLHEAGVLIERRGAADVFVPADALVAVERTPGMAGKFVGGKGIVVLRWHAPGPGGTSRALDTGLRLRHGSDRDALTTALREVVAARERADGPRAPQSPPDPSSEEHA